MTHSKIVTQFGLLLGVLLSSGCSQFDIRKNIPWGEGADGSFEKPLKMSAIWTDSVLQTANKPATRGFGGRLMFYGKADSAAIKTEGTLVVYAFDEANRDPRNVTPNRKFVFTAEQFGKHYSKSELGHSYSVWIPWDVAGGDQKEISLIARFIPKDGGAVVVSDQSKHILPGRPAAEATEDMAKKEPKASLTGEIQQVGYQTPANDSASGKIAEAIEPTKKMTTTTIAIPARFGQRAPTSSGTLAERAQAASQGGEPIGVTSVPVIRLNPSDGRPNRSQPSRPRVLGAPISRLERDHAPSPQHPSEQPSGPQPTPGSAPLPDPLTTTSGVRQAPR